MNCDTLSGHRKYIISLWNRFNKKAKKRCLACDHYYPLFFTLHHRWVKNNFCLHWPEVYHDVVTYYTDQAKSLQDLIKGDHPYGRETCFLFRDRSNKNNPLNQLRINKEYYDMTDIHNRNTIRVPPKLKRRS